MLTFYVAESKWRLITGQLNRRDVTSDRNWRRSWPVSWREVTSQMTPWRTIYVQQAGYSLVLTKKIIILTSSIISSHVNHVATHCKTATRGVQYLLEHLFNKRFIHWIGCKLCAKKVTTPLCHCRLENHGLFRTFYSWGHNFCCVFCY
jgi:hypothetical protein